LNHVYATSLRETPVKWPIMEAVQLLWGGTAITEGFLIVFPTNTCLGSYLSNNSILSQILMLIFHLYKCAHYTSKCNRSRFRIVLLASAVFWPCFVPIFDPPSFSVIHAVIKFSTQSFRWCVLFPSHFAPSCIARWMRPRARVHSFSSRNWGSFDHLGYTLNYRPVSAWPHFFRWHRPQWSVHGTNIQFRYYWRSKDDRRVFNLKSRSMDSSELMRGSSYSVPRRGGSKFTENSSFCRTTGEFAKDDQRIYNSP
jgi:hypothetical protein